MLQPNGENIPSGPDSSALGYFLLRARLSGRDTVKHTHAFELLSTDELGFTSKRGSAVDSKWFLGAVKGCKCGSLLFVPHRQGHRPVEVTPVPFTPEMKRAFGDKQP